MFGKIREEDKCPICKSKMANVNGRKTCKDCGYSLYNRGETTRYTTSVNNDTYSNTNTYSNSNSSTNTSYREVDRTEYVDNSENRISDTRKTVKVIKIVFIVIFIIWFVIPVLFGTLGMCVARRQFEEFENHFKEFDEIEPGTIIVNPDDYEFEFDFE